MLSAVLVSLLTGHEPAAEIPALSSVAFRKED
jgi:hypothetical protein